MPTTKNKFRRFSRFEVAEFNCPGHAFPKHSHDEFVIGTNVAGRETVTLDRRTFEATTDQLTLYNPAQVQSSHASSADWSFMSIYLKPSDVAGLADIENDVVFDLHVATSSLLSKTLIHFVRDALSSSAREDLLEVQLGNLLRELLDFWGCAHLRDDGPSDRQMCAVAEQLLDQIAEPPRLSDVANQLGTSSVALVRAFKRAYGLPPFEWLNVQRINNARQHLRLGRPLVEVAHSLGYADQPHFNRRFRAATGLTPSLFRQVK